MTRPRSRSASTSARRTRCAPVPTARPSRSRSRRRIPNAVVVIAAAAALSSCGGGASGPTVAIIAPDTVLRELGEPCSGGEPYLYAHATAAWRVEDAQGRVVSRGDLPEGKAIAAFNH